MRIAREGGFGGGGEGGGLGVGAGCLMGPATACSAGAFGPETEGAHGGGAQMGAPANETLRLSANNNVKCEACDFHVEGGGVVPPGPQQETGCCSPRFRT